MTRSSGAWLATVASLALAALPAASAQGKTFTGMIRDVPTRSYLPPPAIAHAASPVCDSTGDGLPYCGGPVLHSNRTHVIFWQPAGSGLAFDPGYESLIDTFLTQVAADSHKPTNVYGLSGQYTDAAGPAAYASTFGGAVVATDPLPADGCTEPLTGPGWGVCLTDAQLESEIEHVIAVDRLPTTFRDIYFLLTPRGLGSCTDSSSSECALGGPASGYCGYHSTTEGEILYAVIPYTAVAGHCQSGNPRPNSSTADPAISTISHEHNEVVTDPLDNAWIDGSGNEEADLCLAEYGPALGGCGAGAWDEDIHGGHYYIQEEWSNDAGSCQPRAPADSVSFKASLRASAGKPVSFSADAHDPRGTIVAYDWYFGDGHAGHRRSMSHTFKRAGAYRVVLRAIDSADNYAFDALVVRVAKPLRLAKRLRGR